MTEPDARETVFMGKIARTITHEMTNILAAIGENSALIEDILSLSGDVATSTHERIGRAFRIIEAQVTRGVELAGRLNTLAHSTEATSREIDLNEAVERIAALSERLARLKGIDLRIAAHDQPVVVTGNPLRMQMALFDCLGVLLENLESRSTVVLESSRRGKAEVRVNFAPEPSSGAPNVDVERVRSSPQWDRLLESAKCVDGRIEINEASGELTLIFAYRKRQDSSDIRRDDR